MSISAPPSPITRTAVAPWRRPFHAWLDGVEKGWAIPALLAAFVAVWMLYFSIAYVAGDLHPDVLEAWSVGRTLSWGSGKHPPLMGWFTHAWTLIFPTTDWSLELLAMVNAAVALWAVDLIARRYVRGDKRAVVILLLMLLPAYQFHAQRFNANTVLLAVWPLATYCFLRSFETRTLLWSAATGVLCAVAMLGKYYSVFLIAGFAIAAIAHPQRRAYLTSKAPWVSTIAGLIALAPHLHWLATTGAMPFQYAMSEHSGWTFSGMLWEVAMFFVGICGYLALPAIALLLMTRDHLRTFAANLRQLESGLVLLGIIFAATIILPAIVAIILVTDLPPLWNLQGLFFVAIIAVCCTRFAIDRFDTVNLTMAVIALCFGAVVGAPFYASYR
ncbi:MAG: glycosyltransferase family 39 protein, partial [Afipia sp.]